MPARHRLIEIDWPDFGLADAPPRPGVEEFERRLAATRARMEEHSYTHLVVYADREHFANLAWLTGFDPRFEEALLILKRDGHPLLLVGNECVGYLGISPLWTAQRLRMERYQPFSLMSQERDQSRLITDILAEEGIGPGTSVGAVGWKYYAEREHPQGRHTLDLPSYLADTLRDLAGFDHVRNAADLFLNPVDGLRTAASPAEIAYFEWTNMLASEGLRKLIFALREGMTDHELAAQAPTYGVPFGCHMTLKVGDTRLSLTSPLGNRLRRGGLFSANICYWGANVCRCGWAVSGPDELPEAARDYVPAFAGPYFEAMAEWLGRLTPGRPGGELHALIQERLPYDRYKVFLNAGHLIHLDEWTSSPIFAGSTVPLRSGMVMQVDVIPSNPTYYSTRMEDGVVLADASLRRELAAAYPDMMRRMEQRRRFVQDVLGIALPDEVLPLSNIAGIVPVYFLNPRVVLALA